MPDFWEKVDKTGDCWEWTAHRMKNGYGKVKIGGRSQLPHRVAYEELVGPIPDGLVIDHLCRNRACVNPEHLEAVTMRENNRRGRGFSGENYRKTECVHGHPLTTENLYVRPEGRRACRACAAAQQSRYLTRRRISGTARAS